MIMLNKGFKVRMAAMWALLLLLSVPAWAIQTEGLEGINSIAKEKSKAEDWAAVLKRNWKPGAPEYKRGQELYIDAKAEFDGWVQQLKVDLQSGKSRSAKEHEKRLAEPVKKAQAFIDYVNDIYVPKKQTGPFVKRSACRYDIARNGYGRRAAF